MCVDTCVKISDKSDEKWKRYILYKLTSYEWTRAVNRPWADGSQARVGGEVMVQCIDFFFCMLSNGIVTKCVS